MRRFGVVLIFLVIMRKILLDMVRLSWFGLFTVPHIVYHRYVNQVTRGLRTFNAVFTALWILN